MSSSSLIEQQPSERELQSSPEIVKSLPTPSSRTALGEWLRMLLAAGGIGSLYAWRGGASLLFLLTVCGILMLGGLLLHLLGPRQVKISRSLSPLRPVAGDTLTVEVQVSFSGGIPLPWMIVADYYDGGVHQQLLFPGFRRSLAYSYTLQEVPRGIHTLHGCGVSWGDLTGLFTGGCKPEGKLSFKVLPRPLYLGGAVPDSGMIAGDMMLKRRNGNLSAETADLREYSPGDPLSRIHWKSSARKGTLQSRVPEREGGRMSCIVLASSPGDYEVPDGALVPRSQRGTVPPAFESAVSAAMGLMLSAERSASYVQLYSGGWPEGMARHEGLGQIPGRVQDMLTEIVPDGTRGLSRLLEDASRGWIPGMTVAVITGRLTEESARTLARFLVQGIKVELYYVWDGPAPASSEPKSRAADTVCGSLARLGARVYCLSGISPVQGCKGEDIREGPKRSTLR